MTPPLPVIAFDWRAALVMLLTWSLIVSGLLYVARTGRDDR